MEVLPCSGVQYGGESDCSQQSSGIDLTYGKKPKVDGHGQQVQLTEVRVDGILQSADRPQMERRDGVEGTVNELRISEKHRNGACDGNYDDDYNDDDDDANELASDNCHIVVDTIEGDLPNSIREGESSFAEPTWLEGDESVALWVKVLLISISFRKFMKY